MEVVVTQSRIPLKTRLDKVRKADRRGMHVQELPVIFNEYTSRIFNSVGNNEMFSPFLTNYLLTQFKTE
jgi:hypothetical protein